MGHIRYSLDSDSAVADTTGNIPSHASSSWRRRDPSRGSKPLPDGKKKKKLTFDLRRVANFSIIRRMNDAWKRHKSRKNKKYIKNKDPAKVKATPPPFVLKEGWVEFVDICNSDTFLAVERNAPDKDIGRADVFIKAHTKANKTYQCPEVIEKLQENMNLYPDSNKIGHDDVIAKTLGKDKKGHMMAMGIDIAPPFVANAIHIVEENEDLKDINNELKTMLLNMRKDLDDHIKKTSGVPQIQPSSSYDTPSNSSQATQGFIPVRVQARVVLCAFSEDDTKVVAESYDTTAYFESTVQDVLTIYSKITGKVEASTNQVAKKQMSVYQLPSKILYRAIDVQLKAEADTDEVFALVTLLPESNV
ncbi:hypothetical protein GIB67_028125 [Kingdonia uniflora]|uniref:Uncharacterized protein n=1 Tax=Kingdonia uniflora TaxID=39325 RepID=A0A7J7KZL3_9MAGN|nr:hypothetical protein GIB67_028125 [Kingdonia uniflora]